MSLLKRLEQVQAAHSSEDNMTSVPVPKVDPYRELKMRVHQNIIEEIERSPRGKKGESRENDDLGAERIREMAADLLEGEGQSLSRTDRQRIVTEVVDEVLGFGPITPLINDPTISEIMVNGPRQVYVERDGKLVSTNITFRDNDHILHIIEKIVSPLGRRIDESSPMVDARLPDGSRVNAIIPPLAINAPTITIRKFSKDPFRTDDLVRKGSLSPEMAGFLKACVLARLNIVVSGGTGSGKTTLLNCLSSFIPEDERILTIEDAAELQLTQPHVVTLEARPANIEGKGAVTIRDLVRNSLRMRPNRIVVGEVRGGEALDMLQAMNTGHDGSLTTGHANTPRDMLARLETMVLMAGMDLPVRAIREQIAAAVDVIVQQARFRDGSRKITHITEVQGMEGEVIILQDIFFFEQQGTDERGNVRGKFKAMGIRPKFTEKIIEAGIDLPPSLFFPGGDDRW
ncbi:MAG: CpaF family protein [Bacillota bacterium]